MTIIFLKKNQTNNKYRTTVSEEEYDSDFDESSYEDDEPNR